MNNLTERRLEAVLCDCVCFAWLINNIRIIQYNF